MEIKYFTIEDNRNMERMLADYYRLKSEISHRDIVASSNIASEYQNVTNFLSKMRDALDFVKSSTAVAFDGADITPKVFSLMKDAYEYADSIVTLTGGFNKQLINLLEETRTEPLKLEIMPVDFYESASRAPLKNNIIKDAILQCCDGFELNDAMQNIKVSDVVRVVENAEKYMELYDIDKSNIAESTLRVFVSERDYGTAHVIANFYGEKTQEQEYSKDWSAQIVESSDGFVLNRDPLTPENMSYINSRVEKGNEIRDDNVPQETTIDPARAQGNVRLEEFSDIGTIEEDSGYIVKKKDEFMLDR